MKKFLAFALAAILLLGLLAACGPQDTSDIANRDQQTAEDSGLTIHKICDPPLRHVLGRRF